MANRIARRLTIGAVLAFVSSACTVSQTDIPSLTGPSELALSFAVTATPDSISQDGASQSVVTVTALDANGRTVAGLPFRLDMFVGGEAADYGTLSGKSIVTSSDGRATAVYTAPPAVPRGADVGACAPSPFSPSLPGPCVTISATPTSTGFTNGTNSQTVNIHLVPLGIILPPADTPTASFIVTPTPLSTNVAANFDASASCGGAANASGACSSTGNVVVNYSWNFGDGASATGRVVSHSYGAPLTYTATLTVTNDGGKSASTTKTVVVGAALVPTASFTVAKTAPPAGLSIQVDGSGSTAVGATISSYAWTWGDGTPNSSGAVPAVHTYAVLGTYTVRLTVTDSFGRTGTVTQSVTVP